MVRAVVAHPRSVSKCMWRSYRDSFVALQTMLKGVLLEACHHNKPVDIYVGDESPIRLTTTHTYVPEPIREEERLVERPQVRNTECIIMGDPLDPNDAEKNVILIEYDKMSEPGILVTRQSLKDSWAKANNQEYTGLYLDGCRSGNPSLFVFRLFDNRYVWNAWNTLENYPRCLVFAVRRVARCRLGSYHARIEAGAVIDREEDVYELVPVYGDMRKACPLVDSLPHGVANYDMYGRQVLAARVLPLFRERVLPRRIPHMVHNHVSVSVLHSFQQHVGNHQRGYHHVNVGAICVDWNPNEQDVYATINDVSIPHSIRAFMLHCLNMLSMTRRPARNRVNRVIDINQIHAMSLTSCPVTHILSHRFEWNHQHQLSVPRAHARFFESLVSTDGYYMKNILSRGRHLDEVLEYTFVDGQLTAHGLTMQDIFGHPASSVAAQIFFMNRPVISSLMYNLLKPDELWPYSDADLQYEYGNSIVRLNYGVVSNLVEE